MGGSPVVEQHYIPPTLRHPDRSDLYFFYVFDALFPFMIQVSDTGHVIRNRTLVVSDSNIRFCISHLITYI